MMTQKICKLVRLTFISISSQKQLQFQKKKNETTRNYIPSLSKKKSINEKKSLRTKKSRQKNRKLRTS